MHGGLLATVLSIAVLAALALGGGGIALIRAGIRGKGALMVIAGAVLLGNVLILAWPS